MDQKRWRVKSFNKLTHLNNYLVFIVILHSSFSIHQDWSNSSALSFENVHFPETSQFIPNVVGTISI